VTRAAAALAPRAPPPPPGAMEQSASPRGWLAVLPRSVAGSTFLGDSPPESELLDDTWLLNDFLWDPVAMARGPPRARACAESDSDC
jgi:hypothetical protein